MSMLEFENPSLLFFLFALAGVALAARHTLVDNPRGQRILSFAVRALIMILLILSLAEALWLIRSQEVAILVLADVSESVPATAAAQLHDFLSQLEQRPLNPAKAGLVTFASAPRTLVPAGHHPRFPEKVERAKAEAGGNETSIEKALLYSWEQLPLDTVNRVVLFTDGNETSGDARRAAQRGAEHGVAIYPIPYRADSRDEVLLEDLSLPVEVKKGESFSISVTAHATTDTTAAFTLFRNGFKSQEKEIALRTGANTLLFQETNAGEGFISYTLRMRADKDFYVDNNVSSGIVRIEGEPHVLLLEKKERDSIFLARALEMDNIQTEVRDAQGMPGSLEELAAYDAVIFSDVPATAVSVRQMNLLRSYVEDLGGGFIMIGGEDSFGLGGYFRTSIENVLPVRMRSEKKKDTPGIAMMLVIDRSGSMSFESKLEMAKEAAIATTELLGERDFIGLIAFDTYAYPIVEPQNNSNAMAITQLIEQIQIGGGTSMYPALEMAYEQLYASPAPLKHVIVLTDGQSMPGDFEGIVNQMAQDKITVSTVGIGRDVNFELLSDMAQWGKGRSYFTTDPADIPQIFTKETMQASKSSLIEEPFLPRVLVNHPVIRSIDWNQAPYLYGYVVTSPKATADVILMTEAGDPLLASWRFGLGKCMAFMSDAKSLWAADWIPWPGYGRFWVQVVRDVLRSSQNQGTETRFVTRGGRMKMVIDNSNELGQFVNQLKTDVLLMRPDQSKTALRLPQTAPGRYETEFPADQTGSYLFVVKQKKSIEGGEEETVSDYTRGLTISYKPEYRHLSVNEEFLKSLAAVSGGKYNPTADELFQVSDEEQITIRTPLWPWLIMAALLLFLADVALRRLDLAGHGLFKSSTQRYG
ncbi:MAG: VWA domain-containing protein [bacterium]